MYNNLTLIDSLHWLPATGFTKARAICETKLEFENLTFLAS